MKCEDYARVDLFYAEDGNIYINEINTIPGQTDASIVPQQVKAMGWSLKDFYTGLVDEALIK